MNGDVTQKQLPKRSVRGSAQGEPESREAIKAKWQVRCEEWARFDMRVDGASICKEILSDLRSWEESAGQELMTVTHAADFSGYSRETITRWLAEGRIENHGRKHAPLVRRRDLPIKPGHLPEQPAGGELTSSSKRQIVRSVVAQGKGTR